ncbi:hypothetical protein HYR54_10870 [Candidatus Acetothermia bacterium]|nr:hypothetical protein [Candidatus Acetothermia bacterium]
MSDTRNYPTLKSSCILDPLVSLNNQNRLVSALLNELSRLAFEHGFNPGKIAWAICDELRLAIGRFGDEQFAAKVETGIKLLRILAKSQVQRGRA